jgi:endoglucanase
MAGPLLLGVNLAGAEFGSNVPGVFGTDYTYPTHTEIDYYAAKGMSVVRLPFLWERVQRSENAPLDAVELARLDDVVSYATGKGLKIEIEPHNYGYGFGALIGSTQTPNAAFADLWGKLAFHYQSNSDVMFGLMNEPHDQSASAWLGSANAAIAAIRGAGAVSQEILVPGSYWDGAWTWTSTDNDTVIGTGVQDPAHNFAFEVHQYLDADGSGTHAGAVSATIGVERLTAITQWAEATGNHLLLGEVGVTTDQTSLTAFDGMLTYMQQHTGAWQGVTYWAGGPWWGNYMFSIEPQNGIDKPQMGILVQHLASPGVYNGTPGADYIAATGNLLQAFGNDGNDQLYFNGNQNQLSGGNGDDTLQANGANNHLFGNAGNDRLGVSGDSNQLSGGAGNDTLSGGSGTDTFVFDGTAFTPAQSGSAFFDRILNYDQGTGTFNPAEGDALDFSALLSTAYNHGSGQSVGSLIRVLESPSGTTAIVQIDQDGMANGVNWTTIARLDGVHPGNGVKIILDRSQPAGVTLTAPGLAPTHNFDGDGHGDILWQSSSGAPMVWLMNGTNAVSAGAAGSFNPGPSWQVKGSGDFNGDGKSDILWQGSDGMPAIWLMNGTTAVSVSAAGSFNPGPSWQVKGTGDFNGDGKSDILWQGSDGTPAIWLMDGTNAVSVAAVGPFNPGPSWQIKGTGDFDGDGKSDILWQGSDGTPAIWLMDGIKFVSTSAAGSFNPGPSWQVKGTGDFNGDGKSDILWQGKDGTPAIWLMDGTNATFVGAAGPFNPGPSWQVKGSADFNGDGKSDILWQGSDGTPAIWLMDGTHAVTVGAAGSFNPGHDWHVIV